MRYYAATIQTDFPAVKNRREISKRCQSMCQMIEKTIIGYEPFFDVRLFVLPEFGHQVPIYPDAKDLYDKLAIELPNKHTDKYHKLCKKYGCYIQTASFLEKDADYPGHVFNTTVLIGPTGILSKYRKVNTWIPWEVHTSPADLQDYNLPLFPVVETELGKMGVAICYDWLFPECIREIASQGAEVINRVSAYMDPWGATAPMEWWSLINRTRALENMVYVVAANQGASLKNYPPFSWPGGSMVVDFDGRILASAGENSGEKIVVAPIDIPELRQERDRRLGHDTKAHFRSSAYAYHQKIGFGQHSGVPSKDELSQRIIAAKKNHYV
ncbi:MAG TPA: nitrilase [Oceanospirillales bacterium]|nr:nitrilase [Oceanospirillales bacterium]